ncbi:Smr/MutS family protein [Jannaschia formosa]|uniref:Smr/MutS family protein n=1 Tax=Jannaschia formosa TaxID=2259592 RepID=UPI000E1BE01A|nr:Smr/MutS family protein [Jannaschia formosa]TFL17543.1 DNA mismatch repair protein MutS [Jannaschia formosa]
MRRRRLSAEDRDLWRRYTRSADPLDEARRDLHREAPPPEAAKPTAATAPRRPVQPFELGQKAKARASAHSLASSITDQVAQTPLRMDARVHKRMKAGKLRPEGKLDLHGLTLAQAQPELARFVMSAHASGKRLVLVVTGKGKSKPSDTVMPNRLGVLKHQVPVWLGMAPLSSVVLQITEASRGHGGSGAYYVYLRRR